MSRALPSVRIASHLLVGVLLVVIVVSATKPPAEIRLIAATALTALIYVAGPPSKLIDSRIGLILWGAVVTVAWVGLVILSPLAVWLAFPLFLLALLILPTLAAVPIVAMLTAIAVSGFAWHRQEWTVGGVLGPTLGAAVAIGTVVALRAASAESERRGQVEERERLAREIHDTLAQGLGSIHLLLGAAERQLVADPVRATELVERARQTASANLAESRRLVRSQGPADLAERSLPQALARLAGRIESPPVAFHVDGTPFALPGAHDVALLRIAQEGVTNAVRHAGASLITVTLTYHPAEIALDIVDDGNGDVQEGNGFGLTSMRARVEELHGLLDIEARPGHGTAVAARIPLEPR